MVVTNTSGGLQSVTINDQTLNALVELEYDPQVRCLSDLIAHLGKIYLERGDVPVAKFNATALKANPMGSVTGWTVA
jgi:hypothetical protein